MKQKRKDAFRLWTGFKFGIGFMLGAYVVMWGLDGLAQFIMMAIGMFMKGGI